MTKETFKSRHYATPAAYPPEHIIVRICDLVRGHCGSAAFACTRAGIPKDYITSARRGERNPRLLHVEALLNKCGYQLAIVRRKEDHT